MHNTKAEIAKTGREWQKKLRLQDWSIEWVVAKKETWDDGTMGDVTYSLPHRRARIRIMPDNLRIKEDQAAIHTIVHELLHLNFAPFTEELSVGSIAQRLEEQQINAIAGAITGIYYKAL